MNLSLEIEALEALRQSDPVGAGARLQALRQMRDSGDLQKRPKKEAAQLGKELGKLE